MQTEPPAVRAEVSLAESVLSLGEPIVLSYTFIGTRQESVELHLGRDKEGWLTPILADAEGNLAPPIPNPRMRQGGGYSYGMGASANSHSTEYAVVTRLLRPTHSGKYRLTARVRIPYKMKSQPMAGPFEWEQVYGTVLTREDTFALTLTALEPSRLRAVAERLAGQAQQDGDVRLRALAIKSLFSMPGEYVLPVWRAVTTSENPRLLDQWGVISDELARVQSADTADLLAQMVWNPPPAVTAPMNAKMTTMPGYHVFTVMGLSNVAVKFNNMYFTADPALKQHIEELSRAHGRGVPDGPITIVD